VAIKRKLGLSIQLETRDTDVLLLKLKNPNAPGLVTTKDASDYPIINLVWQTSGFLGKPVIDQSGLTGRYNLSVQWPPYNPHDPLYHEKGIAAYKQALLDQLGLELVPSREPIEMLVVEKAN
jgi:uncharacterized protein (TIGR03435 family)